MPDRSTAPSHDHEPAPIVPRAQRGSVLLIATIEHDGKQEPTRHRVRDLSTGGVRIDNALVLRVGDTVTVSIGAVHTLAATVRWIRDGLAGLAFAAAIDPEQARKKPPANAIPPRAPAPASAPRTAPAAPAATPPASSSGWIANLWDPYRR